MKTALDSVTAMLRILATCLAVATALAACGGSTTADNDNGDPLLQSGSSSCAVGAIEGGGRQKLSGVVTRLDSDDRVAVSGVRIDVTGAEVFVDGTSASVADLRSGNVVTVNGAVDLGTRTGCATVVYADADIAAAVDSVDLDGQRLRVLGQEVRVDAATLFADDPQGHRLASLQPGDRIRVTGLYADGVIVATRIDPAPGPGYFVAGVVASLDTPSRRFRINEIVVEYENAILEGFEAGGPRTGDMVRLTGSLFEMVDAPPQAYTVVRPERIQRIQRGTPISVSPASASVYEGGSVRFTASSGADTVTWRVTDSNGSVCTPGSCGTIDPMGRYTAPTITGSVTSILVTATSITDSRNTATATVVLTGFRPQIAGQYTLSGEVFAIDTGPVADAAIDIWIQLSGYGYAYWYAHGPMYSNALGLFEAPYLPRSAHISVWAPKSGYVQPCAVTMHMTEDSAVRVEVMSASTLDAFDPPRPQLATEPSLSGNVFEATATGREPVPGAMVWVEEPNGITFATTLSDRGGNYFVCNLGDLPTIAYLTVVKPGFVGRTIGPINSSQSATLDVELQRE